MTTATAILQGGTLATYNGSRADLAGRTVRIEHPCPCHMRADDTRYMATTDDSEGIVLVHVRRRSLQVPGDPA